MTVQEFQDLVHTLYQGDTSTPSDGATDWNTRLVFLENSINIWDSEEGILWNELWQLNSVGQSAQTTDGTTTAFATPTDFVYPGGFVRLVDAAGDSTYYTVKKPEDIELYRGETESFAYFTGNESAGFYMNFLSAPATGYTIDYPYYKKPTAPTAAGDDIEMSKPAFAVQMTLSKMHELDGEGDRSTLALSKAGALLRAMRVLNTISPHHQPNPPVDAGGTGFGS
ncbi:hypothetical protein KAU11_04655 [Candidatus Babeliales bacterium]|nr:hypothetical protein [Candidatus Babeliales bacterium]